MADSVPNFPLDRGTRVNAFVANATEAYRHPYILKLIELGVLPIGCMDFSVKFPVHGVVTIQAEYHVDADLFERSIRECYKCQPADPASPPK